MRNKFVEHCPDGTFNKVDDIVDGQIGSDIRRSIAKDYLNGRCNLHIHVRFRTEEYCAIFDRDSQEHPLNSIESGVCSRNTQFLTKSASGEQQVSMFIRVTQDLEIPEIPPIVQVPRTVARLKRIYDGNYCVGHPLELTSLVALIFDDVIEDGEFIAGCGLIPLRENELPNKMVEGTPEVVQHLSDTQAEVVGQRWYVAEAVDLLSCCVIDIVDDSIGFEVTEGRQIHAQCLALLCGPVKFSTRTYEGGHNDTLQKDSENTQRAFGYPCPLLYSHYSSWFADHLSNDSHIPHAHLS